MHLLRTSFLAAVFALTANACTNCTNESTEPLTLDPAPWAVKGDVYSIFLLPILGIPLGNKLPTKAVPPLERQDPKATQGDYIGLLGTIQIIRYKDTPVGPYDELLISPGYFEYEKDGKREQNLRISRIYVSNKYAVYSGRISKFCPDQSYLHAMLMFRLCPDWNLPKHVARFEWTSNLDGSEHVKVYPYDTTGDETESEPSEKPWFQATFSPLLPENLLGNLLGALPLNLPAGVKDGLDLNPRIPFSTDLYKLVGINATQVQPPIPARNDALGALASGGSLWKSSIPGQFSTQTSVGTFDLDQSGGDGEQEGVNAVGDEYYPNFWPGLLRTTVGLRQIDTDITFSAPQIFEAGDL